MKFVLKVLVLVCLIVMSKLAKNETITLQMPVAKAENPDAIFTTHSENSVLAGKEVAPVSSKFVKGSLQLN